MDKLCQSFWVFTLFLQNINKKISKPGSLQVEAASLIPRTPSLMLNITTTVILATRRPGVPSCTPNCPPNSLIKQTPLPLSPPKVSTTSNPSVDKNI